MSFSKTISFALAITGAFAGPLPEKRGVNSANDNVQSPWAGAVLEGSGWRSVTGTVTIPHISGQDPSSGAAFWVGIDGYECTSAIWQTGITVYGNGYIRNWYEWWPNAPVYDSKPFKVSAGDVIRMTVHATSANSGTSLLENLTNGQTSSSTVYNQRYYLCGNDAEWIVEDFEGRRLANFGGVTFTNNSASDGQANYGPQGSRITEVMANGYRKTSSSVNGNNVNIRYIGQ